MAQISYSDVFSITHAREFDEEIAVGDIVGTGPNLYPHYAVLALHGDKAWLRNIQTGMDAVASLMVCRKVVTPTQSVYAAVR